MLFGLIKLMPLRMCLMTSLGMKKPGAYVKSVETRIINKRMVA